MKQNNLQKHLKQKRKNKLMKKLLFLLLISVFCSVNLYAKTRGIIFFVDDVSCISQKTMNKIATSNEFKFVARINPQNPLSPDVENLINSGKMEPVLEITSEPYFPLISEKISVNNSLSFNRSADLDNLLETYKQDYNNLFDNGNYGLFLTGGIVNTETLKTFYKHDFIWTTVQAENTNLSGAFYDEGLILFALSKKFPVNEKQISTWLAQNKSKYIAVLLTQNHLKNDKLMAYIINLFETSNYTDVMLPSHLINKTIELERVTLYKDKTFPKDVLIKLAKASEEVDSQEDSPLYETVLSELSNMYSYDLIKKILKNDETAKKLFDISFKNIFKLFGQDVPEVATPEKVYVNEQQQNQESCFVRTDKGYKLNSTGMIKSFEVRSNDGYVDFYINSSSDIKNFDIYIDMNGIIDTGEHKMLKPLESFLSAENAWEYAIRVEGQNIYVYKFFIDSPELIKKLVKTEGKVRIPKSVLRGNPYNWAYQVAVIKDNKVVDFLANGKEREKMLSSSPLQLKLFKCNE